MLEADRDLFARLLVVAQAREMDLREFSMVSQMFHKLKFMLNKIYFYSTVYSYIQHFIFMFNNAHSLFIFN